MAAPARPPINVCDDDDGKPISHVNKFHIMAARSPEKTTGRKLMPLFSRTSTITVFETVSATPNSPIIYLAMKNATKLKKADHNTACPGVKTLVETTVAIELAASWKPFIKSNPIQNTTISISQIICASIPCYAYLTIIVLMVLPTFLALSVAFSNSYIISLSLISSTLLSAYSTKRSVIKCS